MGMIITPVWLLYYLYMHWKVTMHSINTYNSVSIINFETKLTKEISPFDIQGRKMSPNFSATLAKVREKNRTCSLSFCKDVRSLYGSKVSLSWFESLGFLVVEPALRKT